MISSLHQPKKSKTIKVGTARDAQSINGVHLFWNSSSFFDKKFGVITFSRRNFVPLCPMFCADLLLPNELSEKHFSSKVFVTSFFSKKNGVCDFMKKMVFCFCETFFAGDNMHYFSIQVVPFQWIVSTKALKSPIKQETSYTV